MSVEGRVPVELVHRPDMTPKSWVVEMIDSDGGVQRATFSGPRAKERAIDYASRVLPYGGCWYQEIWLTSNQRGTDGGPTTREIP